MSEYKCLICKKTAFWQEFGFMLCSKHYQECEGYIEKHRPGIYDLVIQFIEEKTKEKEND